MSVADEIEKLHRLKESGAIDEREFQQAKARLLGGEHSGLPTLSPTPADSLHGIGGWLLILCIVLTILTPLVVLVRIFSLLQTAQTYNADMPDNYMVVIGIGAIYSLYVGVNLWGIRPRAVAEAKRFFVIAAFAPLGMVYALQMDNITLNAQDTGRLIVSGIAPSILWYQYLKKSRRVSNTYPQP